MKHSWYGPKKCIPALVHKVQAPYAVATDLIALCVQFGARLTRWPWLEAAVCRDSSVSKRKFREKWSLKGL